MIKHLLSAVLVSTTLIACGGGGGSTGDTNNPIGNDPDIETPIPTTSPQPTVSPAPTITPIPTSTPVPTTSPIPTTTPVPTTSPVPTTTPIPTPLSITSANALELTAATTTSVLKTDIPISTEIAGILTSVVARNSATLDHSKLLATVLDTSAGNAEKTRFPTSPLACEVSGTLNYSGSVQSLDHLTEGDLLRLVFDNCVNSSGNTSNGSITYTVTTFEGTPSLSGDYSLSYQMEFNFTHSTPAQTIYLKGDIATGVSQNNGTHSTALRSSSLRVTVNGNTREIDDFIYVQTFDENNSTLSLRTSGFINSDELGGTLRFESPVDLLLTAGNNNPNAGVYKIQDAQGATIVMTVLADGLVSLAIDEDGDGKTDNDIQTTWNEVTHFFDS